MNANDLAARYRLVRDASLALTAPLSAEDCCVQSMPDASPVKWHLAHTTWFFETFVLERWERDFKPFHAAFRVLYNSYYNAVGDKHPRPQRELLTRPELAGVLAYRADVDRRVQSMLAERAADSHPDADADLAALLTLGLHHEQQHQELILTDLKHLFSHNPLAPAYAVRPAAAEAAPALSWHDVPGGIVEIGHAGTGFCYDNEKPRHRVFNPIGWRRAWSPTASSCSSSRPAAMPILSIGWPRAGTGGWRRTAASRCTGSGRRIGRNSPWAVSFPLIVSGR